MQSTTENMLVHRRRGEDLKSPVFRRYRTMSGTDTRVMLIRNGAKIL